MKKRVHFFCCLLACFGFVQGVWGQEPGVVKGKIVDPDNRPIPGVSVRVDGTEARVSSDANGAYQLALPGGKAYWIRFTHAGHQPAQIYLNIRPGFTYDRPVKMLEITLDESVITDQRDPTDINDPLQMQLLPIDTEDLISMPSFNRSIEGVMKTMPGVSSNNEFSSQYRVRGGNFDENLVYVNGIEIYRPFLARAGQQEGLGFSNPDMAREVAFSTGGFAAQYGDKLSSVLDITYRDPKAFRATAELGLITTNFHVEGRSKARGEQPGKFTYLMGARRFATTYLLNSLETRGDYKPSFLDFQGMFTYRPVYQNKTPRLKTRKNGEETPLYFANEPWKLTAFVAATRNRYLFEPSGRETTFGTLQQAFRLRVGFVGQEISAYTTGLAALLVEHQPNVRWKLDYTLTAFRTQESELIDVEGGYLLGEVNTSFGSEEFNESDFDRGIGSEIRHARNYLTANVLSAKFSGRWTSGSDYKHQLRFGLTYRRQEIRDDLKEYIALDSADYLIDAEGAFNVDEFIRAKATLNSNLYKAYLQHEWQLGRTVQLVSGVRTLYYDLLDEWMLSPRFQLVQDWSRLSGDLNLRLRLAGGVYHQPPFYRELRRFDGSLNLDMQAQRAMHLIAGLDYQFEAWGRPFKLFSEIYYKQLYNLIPYEVQNVRLRYYPDETAHGYAYGWDARINGEFIKGVDSWVSLGLLKTSEDIVGDDRGYVPRPTDQRVSFAMYFQDELPLNPTYKVHVNYVFGSGLRFGPPTVFENRTAFDFPAYHRVDLGFSKLITFTPKEEARAKRGFESIWATLEIFNLFQRENTVSHIWIRDLDNNQFAVPNYLSARLLNLRVVMRFR